MRAVTMQADQLEPFARYLDEHPGFSPLLMGAPLFSQRKSVKAGEEQLTR